MSKSDKLMSNYNWEKITHYMDKEIREKVHFELSPCGEKEFLNRYLELDPDFDIN